MKNMSIYIRSTAIMLLAILPLCAKEASSQSSQKGSDFMILLRDFTGKVSPENEKNVPQSFFIKKNEKEITAFIQKADRLKIGMSQNDVSKLLGLPSSIQNSAPLKADKTQKIFWNYYLMKKDNNGVNEKFDVYLMLVFSSEKILKEVIFSKGSAYL